MQSLKKVCLLVVLMAIVVSVSAGGKNTTSSINGTVTDRDGNAIAGAEVVLINSSKSVYTDFDGKFEFENVPQEEQKMKVKFISFEEATASFQPNQMSETKIEIRLRSK